MSDKEDGKRGKGASKDGGGREEGLVEEIRELQERLATLEEMFSNLFEPIGRMRKATDGYYKLIDLYMKFGKISPDTILPGIKDDISKEVVQTLFERNGQNVSQITEAVKARRGKASRRIVRQRLKALEGEGIVITRKKGKIDHYFISEEVVKKWSRVLGLDK